MSNINDFVIENGVLTKYIGNDSEVMIPDGVTRIEYHAFEKCADLKKIIISDSVINIGTGAFYGCHRLTSIEISKGVSSISESAFGNCNGLQAVKVSEDNLNYASDEFGVLFSKDMQTLIYAPSQLPSRYMIPFGVKHILCSFRNCCNLIEISIPCSVDCIEAYRYMGGSMFDKNIMPQM